MFSENARVAFIGDSITHSSVLTTYIQDYYLTHLRERRVKVFNCGIGGDTAEGALARLETDILTVRPTEAVIMIGTNDIHYQLYGAAPTEAEISERDALCEKHRMAVAALVERLAERGIPVTLCSSIGRDELSPPRDTSLDRKARSFGATERLAALFRENCAALAGRLKATVDYLTPFQMLQGGLLALGGPSLFTPDRIHASPLGQRMMARIFLAAQGLPVTLPTPAVLVAGWQEPPYSPVLAERFATEQILRNIRWVDPHQAAETAGLDLDGRIAYWQKQVDERRGLAVYDWAVSLYRVYLENARCEAEIAARLDALSDALYD